MKIDELEKRWAVICGSKDFAFGLVQEFISEIHSLPPQDKRSALSLYTDIGQELADRNVSAPNFNLAEYEEDIKKWEKEKKEPKIEKIEIDEEEEFNDSLRKLLEVAEAEFKILRRYALLRLGTDYGGQTKILLFHDTHSRTPVYDKIQSEFTTRCEIINIDNYLEDVDAHKELLNNKYLCLLSLSQRPTNIEFINKMVGEIESFFGSIEQIVLNNTPLYSENFYDIEGDILKISDELKYLVGIDLFDQNLLPSEEKILKKFFQGQGCHTLQYKILSSGFSGSKVLYVQPFSSETPNLAKSIIKINQRDNEKIKLEKHNFDHNIKHRDTKYSMDPERTEKHMAIRYNYASEDSKIDSLPFSKLIDNAAKESNVSSLTSTIANSLNASLFKVWKGSRKKEVKLKLEKYYSRYINISEIIKNILKINNKSKEEDKLIEYFYKIFSYEMQANSKICHGDFHTDNFFIDEEENVFLIDFGDTGKLHAVIDHTTLECALKFRHIPQYIEIETLKEIEKELLEPETFEDNYDFSAIKRDDLRDYCKLINKIRLLSSEDIYDTKNKIDYFISLFLITFRQIRYPDLNQLYAVRSAEVLGKHIVKHLKL